MFPLGIEAWCEHRRTGYPKFLPIMDNKGVGITNLTLGIRPVSYTHLDVYKRQFVYSIKNLKNDRFSFRFKDNAPLEEVMEIIVNVVGQMDYRIVEDLSLIHI